MFLISLIVFCILVLYANGKRKNDNGLEYQAFFCEYLIFIRRCVCRIGYTSFEIKRDGIFEGNKVWWLFHIEGYEDLSDEQCEKFASLVIDQLEQFHPGHFWSKKSVYSGDIRGKRVLEYVRVFPLLR